MRMRTALLVVASVCSFGVAVPAVASASEGEFTYRYYDDGLRQGELVDPPSGICLDIPEVIDFFGMHAFSPHNKTDSSVTMFKHGRCEGNDFYTLRPGGRASDRLLIRSVVFS